MLRPGGTHPSSREQLNDCASKLSPWRIAHVTTHAHSIAARSMYALPCAQMSSEALAGVHGLHVLIRRGAPANCSPPV